jgi:hypothetical protein
MEKFILGNSGFDPLIRTENDRIIGRFGHLNTLVDAITTLQESSPAISILTDTTFTPTITDETNGTFTITNFIIDSVGDVVTFSFAGRFDLDALQTSGTCKFNLPTAFQPTANWSSQTDVNVVISQTNGIITAESKLTSDDSGTKLIYAQLGSTTPAASIRFSAVGRYKIA